MPVFAAFSAPPRAILYCLIGTVLLISAVLIVYFCLPARLQRKLRGRRTQQIHPARPAEKPQAAEEISEAATVPVLSDTAKEAPQQGFGDSHTALFADDSAPAQPGFSGSHTALFDEDDPFTGKGGQTL